MIRIGAHTSAQGGVHKAVLHGKAIGATTIQIFTSNQKRWHGKPIAEEEVARWNEALANSDIAEVMSHDSYLINLGSCKEELLEKSRNAFEEELRRCHQLNISYLNFHPGVATERSEEECIDTIVESLRLFEPLATQGNTMLLIEATAGQGTTVGYRFEHLGELIERTKDILPIGVCIDTCHIFAAGYDLRTKEALEETLQAFDDIVGLEHLKAMHLNDSMKPLGSRRDRHANIGEGEIGMDGFEAIMTHPKLIQLPKYLETPNGETKWPEEIALLKKFAMCAQS